MDFQKTVLVPIKCYTRCLFSLYNFKMGTQCLPSNYSNYFYLKNKKILETKTTSAEAVAELRIELKFSS